MNLATLLPSSSVEHIRAIAPGEDVLNARSWAELDALLQGRWFASVLFDPGAPGDVEIIPATRLIVQHRSVPFVAYVSLTPENLLAVAKLSRVGLADAVVHPAPAQTLLNIIDRAFIHPHAQDFLRAFEASLAEVPPSVVAAILDLFRRPQRYGSGSDIAREAGVTSSAFESSLKAASLGPGKKLVILAKLLRAYGYLRDSRYQVERACAKVGYSHRRVLSEHCRAVFDCTPSRLRLCTNPDDVVMIALEWFYKPSRKSAI